MTERDPICLETANLIVQTLESLDTSPQLVQAVVVNRAVVACPVPLADIAEQLGIAVAGVIATGADLCIAAQKAHLPVVVLEPAGSLAASFCALAESLSSAVAPMLANSKVTR